MDRHSAGDRIYSLYAPTLRSQAGSGGTFRVQAADGERRPLTAAEYEQLMGWSASSTALGITADGSLITISRCQRQKILGNGVIPAEITNICQSLTPFINALFEVK